MKLDQKYAQAATALRTADALLIGAGAGMGVDSGLPDFRGNEGFWKAYPAFRGQSFIELANPKWFFQDPPRAWGFYGHRLLLYRRTPPHEGFAILRQWAEQLPTFVFTSNVDGHFQKAGFPHDRIVECHGSIHHLQCIRRCSDRIWPADDVQLDIDPDTFRATSPLPRCPACGSLARPNVRMFGDYFWNDRRTAEQTHRYHTWLNSLQGKPLVALEFGAGRAIPTVRLECEQRSSCLIRINPREAETSRGVSLPAGALEAIRAIQQRFQ